jgi:CheY-like chemotaxis protein
VPTSIHRITAFPRTLRRYECPELGQPPKHSALGWAAVVAILCFTKDVVKRVSKFPARGGTISTCREAEAYAHPESAASGKCLPSWMRWTALHNGCRVQGFDWNLPRRKFDHQQQIDCEAPHARTCKKLNLHILRGIATSGWLIQEYHQPPYMNNGKGDGNVHALRPLDSDLAKPKARVLVVDDDLDTVHSMAMLIKMMGHEVQFAINGFAGIDIARSFRPDVILLDINLPDFKGDHLAKQLKYEPGLERTYIVAVSGRSDDQMRQHD